jgi:hypothetical protein
MQLARLVLTLRLPLVLAVLGSAVGCGSGPDRNAPSGRDENGMLNANKEIRQFHKKQRESAKANPANRRIGKPQGNSGS